MDDSTSAHTVIQMFGGLRPLAAAIGTTASTVQHWKATGRIPPWRQPQIEAAAAERGLVLPLPLPFEAARAVIDRTRSVS